MNKLPYSNLMYQMTYLKFNFKSPGWAAILGFWLISCQFIFAQDTNETPPEVGTTQKAGDFILFALPAATLASTFIVEKGKPKGAWQFTKGLILTEAVTYGLKFGINKQKLEKIGFLLFSVDSYDSRVGIYCT